jgi:multi-copper polyphenol oxidoreductase laccase/nitrite/sulfite reductase ferredoxin-like protein
VFARSGGISSGGFNSLNLGLSVGDDPKAVRENRRLMMARMGIQRAFYLDQVHGKTIHVLTEETRAFQPNNTPRWPEMTTVIKKIIEVYAGDAHKYERLGEWAERIGWERFFDKCELPFTHHLIDDFRDPAYYTWRQTSQFKF